MTGSSPSERRRAAALAGHRGDEGAARSLRVDPDPAVRATALGALARIGALDASEMGRALADTSPLVRRRACELAARMPEVDVSALLDDPNPSVVEVAAWSVGEQLSTEARRPPPAATVSALAAVATGHADALCRESAVAALGAIGDPAGIDAVLGALTDRPPVRRRAVLALAAFEGPMIEAALRAALEDRDWQVRQAAEDLLGTEGRDSSSGPPP